MAPQRNHVVKKDTLSHSSPGLRTASILEQSADICAAREKLPSGPVQSISAQKTVPKGLSALDMLAELCASMGKLPEHPIMSTFKKEPLDSLISLLEQGLDEIQKVAADHDVKSCQFSLKGDKCTHGASSSSTSSRPALAPIQAPDVGRRSARIANGFARSTAKATTEALAPKPLANSKITRSSKRKRDEEKEQEQEVIDEAKAVPKVKAKGRKTADRKRRR